jgi:hypothetical protein
MRYIKQKLAPFVSQQFKNRGYVDLIRSVHCPPLEALYEDFNGGYFWNRALLVRPVQGEENAPLALLEWNNPELWRNMYESRCQGVMFFAEDAFGMQFGIQGDRVVQFDPETGTIADVAGTLDEWCHLLLQNPEYYTGAPVLAAWERKNSPIQIGHRLVPKQLFMLGGEFHSNNMVCMKDLEGLRVRAQFWKMTKDLPDGQKIVFKIEE